MTALALCWVRGVARRGGLQRGAKRSRWRSAATGPRSPDGNGCFRDGSMTSPQSFPREPGLLGIIGNPVRASLSPAMQQAALRHLKLDACYQAFEIAPDQVRTVLRALPPLGFWGVNVTIPYKEKVLPFLDEVDAEAARDRRGQHRRGPGRATARVQHGRRGVPHGPGDRGADRPARRPGAGRRCRRRGARGGVRVPGPRLPLVADRQPLRQPGRGRSAGRCA